MPVTVEKVVGTVDGGTSEMVENSPPGMAAGEDSLGGISGPREHTAGEVPSRHIIVHSFELSIASQGTPL